MNEWRQRYRNGAIRVAVLVVIADVVVTVTRGGGAALWIDATALGLMILVMVLSADNTSPWSN
jgi:hypothetical protein